jgi:hypothetical protein
LKDDLSHCYLIGSSSPYCINRIVSAALYSTWTSQEMLLKSENHDWEGFLSWYWAVERNRTSSGVKHEQVEAGNTKVKKKKSTFPQSLCYLVVFSILAIFPHMHSSF